jgi:hypothetical protein
LRYGSGNGCRERLLSSRLRCLGSRDLPYPQSRCNLPGLRGLEEVLEVAVFAEDIGEGLFDDIVGASTDEGSVLIDLSGG